MSQHYTNIVPSCNESLDFMRAWLLTTIVYLYIMIYTFDIKSDFSLVTYQISAYQIVQIIQRINII